MSQDVYEALAGINICAVCNNGVRPSGAWEASLIVWGPQSPRAGAKVSNMMQHRMNIARTGGGFDVWIAKSTRTHCTLCHAERALHTDHLCPQHPLRSERISAYCPRCGGLHENYRPQPERAGVPATRSFWQTHLCTEDVMVSLAGDP